MTEPPDRDFESLLSHVNWVRALSRHLTSDVHAADDVSQEAIAAALVRPAPAGTPLRGWLGGIVRNLARHRRRSDAHRVARERAAARGESDSSSAHLLERLDVHRAVVEAVARLDEPYRDAILMRYFEGLSPAAIAARTGTPLRTVHTRLHRALAWLRTELDRAHGGDGKTWLLALIPFVQGAQGSGGWSTVGAGALVMDAKVKVLLAAIAVVGVCSTIALWPSDTTDVASGSLAAEAKSLEAHSAGAKPTAPLLEDANAVAERRAASDQVPETNVAPSAASLAPTKHAGRVIDVERAPVAGVKVRFVDRKHGVHDGREATTGTDGGFEFEGLQGVGAIDVASPGWTSVLRPEFVATADVSELVLVVARSVKLSGLVVDARGQAIESASVAVPLPLGLRSRFDAILDTSNTIERSTKSDALGHFELEDVPLVEGTKLVTSHASFASDERAVPASDELHLEIVLRSARDDPLQLVGHVVDPKGDAVEGAWVALGSKSTKSGSGGAFALDLESASNGSDSTTSSLRAVKPGYLPAELAHAPGSAWPDPLILRLGAPALAIQGRVVGTDGQPVAEARVWTDEETFFGYIAIEGGEMTMQAGATIEGILRGDPWTQRTIADGAGRFALEGLLARDYRVHALDRKTLHVATATLDAGVSGVEIRMPHEPVHARVAGRITSLSGAPIEGVEVVLERKSAGVRSGEVERMESFPVKTDPDGLFAFEEISRAVCLVNVHGDDLEITGVHHPIGAGDDLENLEIAIPMRVHAQVDVGPDGDFDQISVLDAKGEKLYLSMQHGSSVYTMKELDLQGGRTEPFTVSEAGKTLVLYKKKNEVRRVPVELERGALNAIRP